MKKPKLLKPKPADIPTPAADTKAKEPPITFKVNIILPGTAELSLAPGRLEDRFLAAGKPSPWHNVDEVPVALRGFIGEPAAPPDTSEWEAEQQAIADSFSGSINESVAEELRRKAAEAAEDAVARNAISLATSYRQDQFERDLQAEHDQEVAAIYEQQQQKKGKTS